MDFPNKYKQYLAERQATHVIECEAGFATYRFVGELVYLEDIFILPEHRAAGAALSLLQQTEAAGTVKGIKKIMGSVVPSLPAAHVTMSMMLKHGFKLHAAEKDIVYFIKDIVET